MSINEFIDLAFYINLDNRTDKKEEIETMLKEYDITFERFNAIRANPGMVGAHRSHLEVLKLARDRKLKNVLILEDDFMFVVDKNTLYDITKHFFTKYGNDYDVLMLAFSRVSGKPVEDDPQIFETYHSHNSAGYIVNERMYDKLIELLEWSLPLLIQTHQHWNYLNDAVWKKLQFPANKWYSTAIRVGKQRPGISDANPGVFIDRGC